jgi:hypothetical protein
VLHGATANPAVILVGGAAQLTAAARDDEPLTYTWSDSGGDCAGSFDDASAASPRWTPPTADLPERTCTLTVTVTDGLGGTAARDVPVTVGATTPRAPVITGTQQTATSAAPGQAVTFSVTVSELDVVSPTVEWTASAGTLAAPTTEGGTSAVSWTAPAGCGTAVVTATVATALGATTHVFAVDTAVAGDVPDRDGADTNCDGVDGDVAAAVFVAPSGNDTSGDGTRCAPFRTIGRAAAHAAADPDRWQVLAAAGTYAESVTLPDGVSLFGRYDATTWSRGPAHETIVQSPTSVGVRIAGTTSVGYLEGLTVRTADAAGGSASARALVLEQLGAPLYVRDNRLEAGRGAAGAAGAPGASAWSGGGGGAPGNWFAIGPGGGGGGGPVAGGGGGWGDHWGGSGGSRGGARDGAGGAPGTPGPLYGNWGGAGSPGGSGGHGVATPRQARGSLVGADWRALGGASGGAGGGGGGGGGGGTGLCFCWTWVPCNLGGGGAGGGGAGGGGGGGGTGGGGSFGVVAINASAAIITDNVIATRGGGAGGAGGGGGGASGGGPGEATLCWGGWNGSGGRGGDGAPGGRGGNGAGGAGGASAGILDLGSPTLTLGANELQLGPVGAGGVPATGAAAGEAGIQAGRLSLP